MEHKSIYYSIQIDIINYGCVYAFKMVSVIVYNDPLKSIYSFLGKIHIVSLYINRI